MKIILYLVATMIAFTSCQQDELDLTLNEMAISNEPFKLVELTTDGQIKPINKATTRAEISGEIALSFESEAEYNKALEEIGQMNYEERLAYTNLENFVSLQKLCEIADQELEHLDSITSTAEEMQILYEEYVNKYEGKLIRNPYDETDISLYVPDESEMYTYLINENRNVVIGKKVRKAPVVNLNDGKTTYNNDTPAMHYNKHSWQWVYDNSKKLSASISIEADHVKIDAGCQKHVKLGWKRDTNRIIYAKLNNLNFPLNRFEYNKIYYISSPIIKSKKTIDNLFISEGNYYSITGKVLFWTDNTADQNIENQSSYIFDMTTNPISRHLETLPIMDESNALGGDFYIIKKQ